MTGPVPQPAAPVSGVPLGVVGPPAVGKPRNRRARLIVAMLAGVVALLCMGGVGVVVSLYDEATKIDRSQPETVVDSFLIAYLVNRDDKEAKLFTCNTPNLVNIGSLRDQLVAREKEFDVKVSVSWGALTRVNVGEGQVDVATQLTISGSANGQITSSRNENWQLRVVEISGSWRVCDAGKTG